jgi:hypothetical protein
METSMAAQMKNTGHTRPLLAQYQHRHSKLNPTETRLAYISDNCKLFFIGFSPEINDSILQKYLRALYFARFARFGFASSWSWQMIGRWAERLFLESNCQFF